MFVWLLCSCTRSVDSSKNRESQSSTRVAPKRSVVFVVVVSAGKAQLKPSWPKEFELLSLPTPTPKAKAVNWFVFLFCCSLCRRPEAKVDRVGFLTRLISSLSLALSLGLWYCFRLPKYICT